MTNCAEKEKYFQKSFGLFFFLRLFLCMFDINVIKKNDKKSNK